MVNKGKCTQRVHSTGYNNNVMRVTFNAYMCFKQQFIDSSIFCEIKKNCCNHTLIKKTESSFENEMTWLI